MKRLCLLCLFGLMVLFSGCQLAKPQPDQNKGPEEETPRNPMIGVFVDINDQFKSFKTSQYLYFYYIEEKNPRPLISTHGKEGFLEASSHIKTTDDFLEVTFSGTVYYTTGWVRITIYPLYLEDGEVTQSTEAHSVGVRDTYIYRTEEATNDYKVTLEINFVPLDKLQEINIREYDKNDVLLTETQFPEIEQEEHILQDNTSYYIVTEVFKDVNENIYSFHTLKDVVDRVEQERFLKRYPNEYGFVSGYPILIKKSN